MKDQLFLDVMKSIEANNKQINIMLSILEDMNADRKKMVKQVKELYLLSLNKNYD